MCYKGKCMHCIDVEVGSFIYAIISIILTILQTCYVFSTLVIMIAVEGLAADSATSAKAFGFVFSSVVALIVSLCLNVVHFIFIVVLIQGLLKKTARYVEAFFIYSVVWQAVGLLGSIVGLPFMIMRLEFPAMLYVFIAVFVAYAICASITWMIYLTYKKLEEDTEFKGSGLLEEECYI